MNKYITIKEASEILGMTKLTLRNWDKSGKLIAHRHPFNNYRVYKIEDIDKVLEMIESNNFIVRKKKDEIRKLAVQHLEEDDSQGSNIIDSV
jgi:excisionase family DNA binding protein